MLVIYIKSFLLLKKHLIMNYIWKGFLSSLIKFKGEQSLNPMITNNNIIIIIITSYLKINKFHSMRETPQFGINYNNKKANFLIDLIINVIMFMTRGQYACCNLIILQYQRLNVEHSSFLSLTVSNLNFCDRKNNEKLTDRTTSVSSNFRVKENQTLKNNIINDNIICNSATIPLIIAPKNKKSTNSSGSKDEFFKQWLVGMTDENGTFAISSSVSSVKYNLIFKVSQNKYNLKVLYYIKKNLNYGTVKVEKNTNNAFFIIRDVKTLKKVILPIFNKYPLLTSKAFSYEKFKQAVLIIDNSKLTKEQKILELAKLKNQEIPLINYISGGWKGKVTSKEDLNSSLVTSIMSKAWLIGFVEAAGSFYLVNKSKSIVSSLEKGEIALALKEEKTSTSKALACPFSTQSHIVHGFGISKKLDPICLEAIRILLHIKTKVVFKIKDNCYMLDTTNSRAIENIIKYFDSSMKGMKSVEYRIWARTYLKHKGNYARLQIIRQNMRVMRKFRFKEETEEE